MTLAVCSLLALQNNADAAPRAAVRGTPAARQPATTTAPAQPEPTVVETVVEPVETSEPILNKSTQFDSVLSSSTSTTASSGDSAMAQRIREQRAAIAAKEATETVAAALQNALGGKNACDAGLRKCMSDDKVCGKDFTKCATDGDTIFGDKLNRCRRETTCTGEEFKLFTTEIKADRDMNVELASYNAVIDCGNEYMKCIANECGMTFGKCLGKTASDKAMNNCKSIATRCKEQDSGLPSRFGTVIGKLRESAEVDIKKDEDRMYKLRDLMKSACEKMGAMFDERSFDCVYTVNFFAGKDQQTPMASRKAYAGDMFTCTQEWFGIDVTTFKENAYRETRSQTAASAAFLGAGIGTTTGLIASGAMDRAIERQKAENKVKDAKEEQKKEEDKEKKAECEKNSNSLYQSGKCLTVGDNCSTTYGKGVGKYVKSGNTMKCELSECKMAGYAPDAKDNKFSCTIVDSKKAKEAEKKESKKTTNTKKEKYDPAKDDSLPESEKKKAMKKELDASAKEYAAKMDGVSDEAEKNLKQEYLQKQKAIKERYGA